MGSGSGYSRNRRLRGRAKVTDGFSLIQNVNYGMSDYKVISRAGTVKVLWGDTVILKPLYIGNNDPMVVAMAAITTYVTTCQNFRATPATKQGERRKRKGRF